MQNRKTSYITVIERVLNSEKLTAEQRETLARFDRFNELEAQCSLSTRRSYLESLYYLGMNVCKPYEKMTKEDLQNYVATESEHHKEGTITLLRAHMKRFFRWLEWVRVNKGRSDEEKEDIKDVKPPYCVRWIKQGYVDTQKTFEDLPTEEEVLKITSCVDTQRDRALIMTLWETGASPMEVLSLRVKDVTFNQYGATVKFSRYTGKSKKVNKLKTPYRYRETPIATSVPDLQLWLSMHPNKNDGEAPLWTSRQGGQLSYSELYRKLQLAIKKAGIKKHLTPYSLRHMRLTQVADVLSSHELKRFAGHSKYSPITARYTHADGKAIRRKVYAERGVEMKEEETKVTPLKVKVCPRCKHKNSPTFKFCAMCSMPLDLKTMFDVQKRAECLYSGIKEAEPEYGFDIIPNFEWMRSMKTFSEWMKKNPDRFEELQRRMWQTIVAEMMQMEGKRVNTKP